MTERHDTGDEASTEHSLEQVQRAEQLALASELALELMHDIRNPLETLGYLTHLTAHEAANEQKVRHYMRLAEEELATMRMIAQHTLGVARVAAAPAPVDLLFVAETALRLHRRKMKSKRIGLNRELPEGMVVQAYHGPLLQVLSNLITNALEAMNEEGTLSLRLRRRGDEVDLLVADNGHGIKEEHLARIGERGFTTKEMGNGLGLALTRRIVEQHRGRLRVRTSVRPGRSGTVFKVSLPVGEVAARGTVAKAS